MPWLSSTYTLKQSTCQNSPEYVISVLALKQQGPHPLGIWTDLGILGTMEDHHKVGFCLGEGGELSCGSSI